MESAVPVGLQAVIDVGMAQVAAFNARDRSGALAPFAKDAVIFLPGRAAVEGINAIEAWADAFLDDPALTTSGTLGSADISASGDFAYTTINFKSTFTHPVTQEPASGSGVTLAVWRKIDGAWKIVREVNIPREAAR